jgi:hypothetical protein
MRRLHTYLSALALATLALSSTVGCNAYRMKTPSGFAEVDKSDGGAHYKGANNVGLRVSTFSNVKGGTLAFWSEDLVRKLGARGYALTRQTPAKSANGLPGTRFDFDYRPPGIDVPDRTYSVVLFVSDKHRVVMQLAGETDSAAASRTQLDAIAGGTKVHGCRAWTDICKGPQPATLATPPMATAKVADDADEAADTVETAAHDG